MIKKIKHKEFLVYGGLVLAFVLLATLIHWKSDFMVMILIKPFEVVGDFIRYLSMHQAGAAGVFSWIIYVLFCLLPLVYPVIKIVRTKKFSLDCIVWLITSGLLFMVMYFFINPHLLQSAFDKTISADGRQMFQWLTKAGLVAVILILVILGIILEFAQKIKKEGSKIYRYANTLCYLLIAVVLFNQFFINLIKFKVDLGILSEKREMMSQFNINYGINVFSIVFTWIIQLVPMTFILGLLYKTKQFMAATQFEMFNKSNITVLNGIIKIAKWTIFVILTVMAVQNLIYFIMARQLLNMTYSLNFPIFLILSVSLIIIFSKILIKAIEVNEENRLTI